MVLLREGEGVGGEWDGHAECATDGGEYGGGVHRPGAGIQDFRWEPEWEWKHE